MAPEAGFEPTTRRLTAGCSTAELLGKVMEASLLVQYIGEIGEAANPVAP